MRFALCNEVLASMSFERQCDYAAELGYDGNINTATGLSSITLPLFSFLGPAALTGPATRMDDGY